MLNTPNKDSNTISLKDSTCEMGESLNNAAHNAGRKIRGLMHDATDSMTNASDYMSGEIRSNPVRSSVIALGVGVLLGALLRR